MSPSSSRNSSSSIPRLATAARSRARQHQVDRDAAERSARDRRRRSRPPAARRTARRSPSPRTSAAPLRRLDAAAGLARRDRQRGECHGRQGQPAAPRGACSSRSPFIARLPAHSHALSATQARGSVNPRRRKYLGAVHGPGGHDHSHGARPRPRRGQAGPEAGPRADHPVPGRRGRRRADLRQPGAARRRRAHALRQPLARRRAVRGLARGPPRGPEPHLRLPARRDPRGALQRRHPGRDLDLDLRRGRGPVRRPARGRGGPDAGDRGRRPGRQPGRRADPAAARGGEPQRLGRPPPRDRRPARLGRGDPRRPDHPRHRLGVRRPGGLAWRSAC